MTTKARARSSSANARLIAQAPRMLEALTAIARGMTNGQKERGETPQSIARAILRDVENGQ